MSFPTHGFLHGDDEECFCHREHITRVLAVYLSARAILCYRKITFSLGTLEPWNF